ncbi:DUF2894 domain-containing protein [Aquabacterium sp.]|uniref:DUF2894 domain-containing protein n=1 Tax=Aquabacterium sp. TaxID=1872578 RepID=UPI003D6D9506
MTEHRSSDVTSMLHALRERGAQRIDPVRFRLIESLLRRADDHGGAARPMLDEKVVVLLQALNEAVDRAEAEPPGAIPVGQDSPPGRSALAKLLEHLAQHKPGAATGPSTPAASTKAKPDSPVDPKTLQFFRRTWSRLSADQRLAQSRSSLPENAGPLNSQHLVHRSLNVMRELSPEYFDLFISHVDALLCLERINEQAAREVGLPARAKGAKKAAGAKRG